MRARKKHRRSRGADAELHCEKGCSLVMMMPRCVRGRASWSWVALGSDIKRRRAHISMVRMPQLEWSRCGQDLRRAICRPRLCVDESVCRGSRWLDAKNLPCLERSALPRESPWDKTRITTSRRPRAHAAGLLSPLSPAPRRLRIDRVQERVQCSRSRGCWMPVLNQRASLPQTLCRSHRQDFMRGQRDERGKRASGSNSSRPKRGGTEDDHGRNRSRDDEID